MCYYNLYNDDCFNIFPQITDKSVDMICCDLPYGTTACKWDIVLPFDLLWKEYNRIIKDNGVIVLFGSEPFSSLLRCSNLEMYRYDYIWEKNNCGNFQLAKKNPLKFHENISVFYKDIQTQVFSDIMKYNMERLNMKPVDLQNLFLSKNGKPTGWVSNKLSGKQIPTRKQWIKICEVFGIDDEYDKLVDAIDTHIYNYSVVTTETHKEQSNKGKGGTLGHLGSKSETYIQTNENYPRSVLHFNRDSKNFHPTQKPIELLEYLIKIYSNENGLVMDNCMGSGTCGVACKKLNRNFIGIEKEKKYFEIAQKRIENA